MTIFLEIHRQAALLFHLRLFITSPYLGNICSAPCEHIYTLIVGLLLQLVSCSSSKYGRVSRLLVFRAVLHALWLLPDWTFRNSRAFLNYTNSLVDDFGEIHF